MVNWAEFRPQQPPWKVVTHEQKGGNRKVIITTTTKPRIENETVRQRMCHVISVVTMH